MAQGKKAGRAYVELGVDDQLTKGLAAAKKQLQNFGNGVKAVGTGVLAAGGGMVAALTGAAAAFANTGSNVLDMSRRTGVAVVAMQELAYAAAQDGVEVSTLEGGIRKMQKTLSDAKDGTAASVDALAKLGLTYEDLAGMKPEDQFKIIGDRLSRIADPTLKAGVAMEVFGKSGTAMLPMLKSGAAGLAEMAAEAHKYQMVMSADDAESAHVLGDAWTTLENTGKALVVQVGAALAPMLTDLALGFANILAEVIKWVKENRDLIVSVFKIAAAVAAAGGALIAAGVAISAFGAVLGGLGAIFSTVVGLAGALGAVLAILMAPVTLIAAGIVGAAGALLYFSGALDGVVGFAGKKFGELTEIGSSAFDGIRDALAAGDIELAAEVLWAGLKSIWLTATSEITATWTNWMATLKSALTTFKMEALGVFTEILGGIAKVQEQSGIKLSNVMGFMGPGGQVMGNMTDALANDPDMAGRIQAAIPDAKKAELAKIEEDRLDALMDAENEIALAKDRLNELVAKAREARERKQGPESDEWEKPLPMPGFAAEEQLAAVPAAVEAAMGRIGSSGTFNADALQSLQASNSPMQRVAKATEQTAEAAKSTAENTRRLIEQGKQGLAFDF